MMSQFLALRPSVIGLIVAVGLTFVQTWPVTLSGLTKSQHSAIQELRERVRSSLPQAYMNDDIWMLRWLTAKDFDIDSAETLLRENLKWRASNNIDSILEEDWTQMDNEYPYQLHTFDKFGRPILYFSFGDWDIRRLSVSGQLPKLNRYFAKMFEEADSKVRELRSSGRDITQFNMILNMDGYSIPQHACFQCLPFYSTLTQTLEAHYPGTAERVIFVNSPTVFEVVLRLIQGVLSTKSRETMKVYGSDRKVWESVLLEFIDRDQFPRDL